jgi:hypothetical protein
LFRKASVKNVLCQPGSSEGRFRAVIRKVKHNKADQMIYRMGN